MNTPTGRASYNQETGVLTITTLASRGNKVVEHKTMYKVANLEPDRRVAFPAFSLSKAKVIKRKAKMSESARAAGLKEEIVWDGAEVWHIAVETFGPTCSCPHATYRGTNTKEVCKHIKAARAVGLLPK